MLESIICATQDEISMEDSSFSPPPPPPPLHTLVQSDPGVPLPLHISLSAPLLLRAEQRPVFLHKLTDAIVASGVSPFHVNVTGLYCVPSSRRTRWSLVLRLR